jgi:hypothetical protein
MRPSPLLSAHIVTSDVTRPARSLVINELKRLLTAFGAHVETVDSHEPEDVRTQIGGDNGVVMLSPDQLDDASMRHLVQPMHIRSVSNALKHHQALMDAASVASGTLDASWSLIVEDDAVFNGDLLCDALRRIMRDAPKDADMIFLGLPSKHKGVSHTDDPTVFDDVSDTVRGEVLPACDSYLVSSRAIGRIADSFLPVRFATNMQFTMLIRRDVRAYSAVPNAFADGSKMGLFTSSLNPNNQLVWSQPYCILALKVAGRSAANKLPPGPMTTSSSSGGVDDDEFMAVWDAQPDLFRKHPDSRVLLADWHAVCGRYSDAERVYGEALAGFDANQCIVSNSSTFMRRYMSVFSHLQSGDGVMG